MSVPAIRRAPPARLDIETHVLVIGAGACGLVASLAAHDDGAEVVVVERDASPSGSTSMSSGFIPAPATAAQRAAGIADDDASRFEADIQAKAKGRAVPELARLAANEIGPALDWLADAHGLEWVVLTDFLYPGHSRHRMHAVPEKTGTALMARLSAAVEACDIPVVTEALARGLFVGDDDAIRAVEIERPDGKTEIIGCKALILACNGYGGNPELVARHIPEMADALYYGHAGNTGDALLWGDALGARTRHLTAYQGHGSLAHPHGVLISWALMMEGAVQVNAAGERFSNEHGGYSEQAVAVLAQPGGIAWNIFDARIHAFARAGFPDYRDAMEAGAIREGETVADLATATGLPEAALAETLETVARFQSGAEADPFGRAFTERPALAGPFYAVKVTGALFHTQGGLMIDATARALPASGEPFPNNLYAAGGAACGVSGPDVSGYLSGNGLLTAIGFGRIAGREAAKGA
ncbi:FAD-dependent oxidoreductase [Stappia sp. ES.058]|uniref:FAD-dependent oxidoreductase n=1 Tax=Stappia sp. ES.058 TaxID=1881061 RepID=UPI000879DC2F|nr:FAD-dependent oxidoreductase [Stappia sp. ES.058]SDU14436.1 fumarate reductase flavoprotein subunit [Stappia sp. ES.058]